MAASSNILDDLLMLDGISDYIGSLVKNNQLEIQLLILLITTWFMVYYFQYNIHFVYACALVATVVLSRHYASQLAAKEQVIQKLDLWKEDLVKMSKNFNPTPTKKDMQELTKDLKILAAESTCKDEITKVKTKLTKDLEQCQKDLSNDDKLKLQIEANINMTLECLRQRGSKKVEEEPIKDGSSWTTGGNKGGTKTTTSYQDLTSEFCKDILHQYRAYNLVPHVFPETTEKQMKYIAEEQQRRKEKDQGDDSSKL
uniref:Uncharacterized protein n=1 Tax=Clytia hemisphaerica TaxID=252671 RepID=A0A7M5X6C8_9CNID